MKPKSLCVACYALHKLYLGMRVFFMPNNMQLPHIIAERAIHLLSSNGWAELWPQPIKFLVDIY